MSTASRIITSKLAQSHSHILHLIATSSCKQQYTRPKEFVLQVIEYIKLEDFYGNDDSKAFLKFVCFVQVKQIQNAES